MNNKVNRNKDPVEVSMTLFYPKIRIQRRLKYQPSNAITLFEDNHHLIGWFNGFTTCKTFTLRE